MRGAESLADTAAHQLHDGFPDRASLRRAVRKAIEVTLPEIRIVAEGFLAEVSPIDLLAVGGDGELISIRIAGPGGDAAALICALADLSWLRPRQTDFRKLAPGLGSEPSTEPRVLLVASEFGRETLVAADNFPAGTVQIWRCRSDTAKGRAGLQVESVAPGPAKPAGPRPATQRSEQTAPLTAPPGVSAFRTGLVETDLDLAQRPDPGVRPGHRSSPAIAFGV
jgi:hypothetical protein